jgi:hypothetical protein
MSARRRGFAQGGSENAFTDHGVRRPHVDGAKANSKLGPEIRADKKLTSREQVAALAAYQD